MWYLLPEGKLETLQPLNTARLNPGPPEPYVRKRESKMIAFCGNILVMLVTVGIFVATVNFGQTPSRE